MARIKIEFEVDDAVFPNVLFGEEVARILASIENDIRDDVTEGVVADPKGKTVGGFSVHGRVNIPEEDRWVTPGYP